MENKKVKDAEAKELTDEQLNEAAGGLQPPSHEIPDIEDPVRAYDPKQG